VADHANPLAKCAARKWLFPVGKSELMHVGFSRRAGVRLGSRMVVEAAGIEKERGHPQTSCNTMLYALPSSSYGVMVKTARTQSKGAFDYSMVPILGAVVGLPVGGGECWRVPCRFSQLGSPVE
jgi:hypothetical protein